MPNTILVTGGAGFIGSNFILQQMRDELASILNLDKLTYAGNLHNLDSISTRQPYQFTHGDIGDRSLVRELLEKHQPVAIVHFAAESHVDRSIRGPEDFIRTNIDGTFALLEETRAYWTTIADDDRKKFRFLHVSTDEVYGSLGPEDAPFTESTPYAPNSPYSASKAASDHLVRAYQHTYGLQTTISNCSNNYGPYQFPEKLIPLMISQLLAGKSLPVYGDGRNIRDWLHVEDHCRGIEAVLKRGKIGEVYNIGGGSECQNIDLVRMLCSIVDRYLTSSPELCARFPSSAAAQDEVSERLIRYVKDRPGHDRR